MVKSKSPVFYKKRIKVVAEGGIKQLTMNLTDEREIHGIIVHCLAPGWFQTEQNKVVNRHLI